jgi:hypothetical protein
MKKMVVLCGKTGSMLPCAVTLLVKTLSETANGRKFWFTDVRKNDPDCVGMDTEEMALNKERIFELDCFSKERFAEQFANIPYCRNLIIIVVSDPGLVTYAYELRKARLIEMSEEI